MKVLLIVLPIAVILALVPLPPILKILVPDAEKAITQIIIEGAPGDPVTFGHVFRQGDVPPGKALSAYVLSTEFLADGRYRYTVELRAK